MNANTSTSLARSASTLAGPVFTTAATPTNLSNTKSLVPHRPNKAELQSRLFHAHVRAQVRRLRQSILDQDLPFNSKPRRTTRASAAPVPRNLPTIITSSGFAILAPTAIRPAHPSTPNAPKLGPLPTPPATPEPETRPLLPTRRSRAAPLERVAGSLALNELGEDPILTPNHVFPDNLRRTPGAAVGKAGKAGSDMDYFHLPPGLLETPAVEQSTSTSTSTSTPPLTTPVGLGITVPTNDGWRSSNRPRAVVGLGITGVDFEEDGRLERSVPAAM
uniref:Zn(2)-C6 fungal-type domain-containing protein n=1 Tax=Ganoderma boninense TaxID=34458 RepID=A0A5K1JWL8_9APHY|nr:Zn(2)-C6 fungal-type domain-containing protein [Ganoderma boninense]